MGYLSISDTSSQKNRHLTVTGKLAIIEGKPNVSLTVGLFNAPFERAEFASFQSKYLPHA